jgi:NitT/TauT family transport system substrate-binding protein
VAAFLAVYLRAWSWMKANPDQAVAMMKKFYQDGGVAISDASMRKEFATRPTFDLTQQLDAMDRSKGPSEADKWFTSIAQFMRASGALAAVPEAKDYIDDSLMKRVQADPKLAAFASDTK